MISEKNLKKSFCSVPWREPFVGPNGNYSLCCLEIEVKKQKKIYVDDDFQQHWNGEYMKSIRKKMLTGVLPKECSVCTRHEKVQKDSLRQRRNLRYLGQDEPDQSNQELKIILNQTDKEGKLKDIKIEGIQFAVGNICQLGCVSCSPLNSSYLEQEYKTIELSKMYKDRHQTKEIYSKIKQNVFDDHFYNFLKKNINAIKHLHVTGGEPFLSKKFFNFIEWCVENNHTEKILHIQTNGITMPSEIDLENLKKFKEVCLYISCDAVGNLEEYVRFPTRWNEKDQCIITFKQYFNNITLNATVHALNVIGITDLISYCLAKELKITLNLLEEPKFLHVKNLLPEIKLDLSKSLLSLDLKKNTKSPWLEEQISSIINSLCIQQDSSDYIKIKNMINLYKEFRKIDYFDLLEFYNLKTF